MEFHVYANPQTLAGRLQTVADVHRVMFADVADAWEALPWWRKLGRRLRGRGIDPDEVRRNGREWVKSALSVTEVRDPNCPPGFVYLSPKPLEPLE